MKTLIRVLPSPNSNSPNCSLAFSVKSIAERSFTRADNRLLVFLVVLANQPANTVDAFEKPECVLFRDELDVRRATRERGVNQLFEHNEAFHFCIHPY